MRRSASSHCPKRIGCGLPDAIATLVGLLLFASLAWAGPAGASAEKEKLHLAVATNFAPTARVVADLFHAETGQRVVVSEGSTGKHYAQILHGAPFEVFLSADVERPRRLEARGQALPESRFVYALGRLALFSAQPGRVEGPEALESPELQHLAIANPELAPYGAAARAVMRQLGLWARLQPRLVRGQDIGQTFQFVATGNAELGFVARSQLVDRRGGAGSGRRDGSSWLVPTHLHPPIEQAAVLLERGRDNPAGRAFLVFLRSETARAVIDAAGYDLPPVPAP